MSQNICSSFDENNRFIDPTGAIKENTLVRVDPATGHGIESFGAGRSVRKHVLNGSNQFAKKQAGILNTIEVIMRSVSTCFRFYMPHGLTIDKQGNLWVTDVGLHQVYY